MISLKQIITLLILISFIMIIFFSFSIMMHQFNEHTYNNCPFSVIGASLCPQETLEVALHHIAAYQSFLSVVMSVHIISLIIFLFSFLNVISVISLPLVRVICADFIYRVPFFSSYKKKTIRWFALHEYSPAIY